jgi:hypothetical protein
MCARIDIHYIVLTYIKLQKQFNFIIGNINGNN